MRSLALLCCLFALPAGADELLRVESHTLLRLPGSSDPVRLQRLEVAEHGTLLIPASVTELHIGELLLGLDSRIGIAPSEQPLRLAIDKAEVGEGARISAHGAPGTVLKPATAGRELNVRLEQASIASLTVDVRGGRGAPGYRGLDGANGQAGGCTWGSASQGHDGQDGGDGKTGAAGGKVRLEVPQDLALDTLTVLVDGGEGGPAGAAGKGGRGGASKGCLLYSVDGASNGQPGQVGAPGAAGTDGDVQIVRF